MYIKKSTPQEVSQWRVKTLADLIGKSFSMADIIFILTVQQQDIEHAYDQLVLEQFRTGSNEEHQTLTELAAKSDQALRHKNDALEIKEAVCNI